MIESLKKNKIGILLMICSSVFVCFGQLLWKLSNQGNLIYLILGFGLYGIGAILMMVAYKFGSLSVLQPVLSINYVFTLIIGFLVLGEPITTLKVVGTLIIMSSVVLIGGGDD